MKTNVNYTMVGLFVITLISFTVIGIIWLSSGFTFEHYSTYKLYMKESITGLNIESPVEFNGVNVGTVSSIKLNPQNPNLVEVLLEVDSTTSITQGTVATLRSRGITGITYVAMNDTSNDLRPLVRVGKEQYPVIKTAPSFFVRVDTALSQLAKNLQTVTESIQSLLDKENQQSIKSILANLDHVTAELSENSHKMTHILDNTSKASQQFGPLLQFGVNAMNSLQSQTLPEAYRLMTSLNIVTHNLIAISADLKQNPAILIRGAAPATLGPGESK